MGRLVGGSGWAFGWLWGLCIVRLVRFLMLDGRRLLSSPWLAVDAAVVVVVMAMRVACLVHHLGLELEGE
jgi:hypothetical protein